MEGPIPPEPSILHDDISRDGEGRDGEGKEMAWSELIGWMGALTRPMHGSSW
jgi:hypothetical protein